MVNFWPRATHKGPKRIFDVVVLVLVVETLAKYVRKTEMFQIEQNVFQIEQNSSRKEHKLFHMFIWNKNALKNKDKDCVVSLLLSKVALRVLCGIVWHCVTFCDILWYFVTLFGILWHYIFLVYYALHCCFVAPFLAVIDLNLFGLVYIKFHWYFFVFVCVFYFQRIGKTFEFLLRTLIFLKLLLHNSFPIFENSANFWFFGTDPDVHQALTSSFCESVRFCRKHFHFESSSWRFHFQ